MNKKWLEKCFYVAETLYCVYPYEILEELYSRGEDDALDKEEVIAFAEAKPFIEMDYVDDTYPAFEALGYHEPGFFRPTLVDDDKEYRIFKENADKGNAYALAHISELEVESLLKDQGDTTFYIPSKDEIDRISNTGINENKYYGKLKKMMRLGIDADGFTKRIWQDFSASVDFSTELSRIVSILDIGTTTVGNNNALNISLEELNKIAALVVECYNHTNLRERRGWEPQKLMMASGEGKTIPSTIVPMSEMAAKQTEEAESYLNSMGVNVDYDAGFGSYNMMVDGKLKRVKVGRNDPCPCGSGKKYKKCHGRGETIAVQKDTEKSMEGQTVDPWNTIVIFAKEAEEVAEGVRNDFYFYATKEPTLYLLDAKQNRFQGGEFKPTEKVKGFVQMNEDEPDVVTILNDKLFHMLGSGAFDMEEVQGALAIPGYEEDGILMVKLRKAK